VNALEELKRAQMKPKKKIPQFNVGDTVRVHFRIVEGEKERIQVFEGTVISRKGAESPEATFTVRRVVSGEGVERVFPLHSPRVEKVEIVREGHVRRAKLYYLRDRVGKAARVPAKARTGPKLSKAERKKLKAQEEAELAALEEQEHAEEIIEEQIASDLEQNPEIGAEETPAEAPAEEAAEATAADTEGLAPAEDAPKEEK